MTVANVYVFAGQSNMLSFGTLNNTSYPGGWTAAMIGSAWAEPTWNGATNQWVQYVPGSASYFGGGTQYWGPEAGFALCKRLVTPQVPTYIVKYSIGGVGMAPNQGQRGASPDGNDFSPFSVGKAFDGMATTALNACNALTAIGYTPVIQTLCAILNESDCFEWSAAKSVEHDLPIFGDVARARFSNPNMKFVIGRTKSSLGSGATSPTPGQLPYVDLVRAGQEAADDAHPLNGIVDLDGIASGNDSPGHYDRVGVPTIGSLFYAQEQLL